MNLVTTYITLKVLHSPQADLCQQIAQRAYNLNSIGGSRGDVEVMACFPAVRESEHECANGHAREAVQLGLETS